MGSDIFNGNLYHPSVPEDSEKPLIYLMPLKSLRNLERWLGDLDSNQGCPGQSQEFYR